MAGQPGDVSGPTDGRHQGEDQVSGQSPDLPVTGAQGPPAPPGQPLLPLQRLRQQ